MPELPEVESLRLSLIRAGLLGRKIFAVEILEPKIISGKGNRRRISKTKTEEFKNGLKNKKIIRLDRRAKNLIFRLSDGGVLLVHLKMTGQLVYRSPTGHLAAGGHPIEKSVWVLPNSSTRLVFQLDQGTLFYNDTRKFGYLLYYPDEKSFEREEHFQALGPEPLSREFTLEYFIRALKQNRRRLKAALLDQGIVTGLGNIYCDEVAFAADLRPNRVCSGLKKPEAEKLYAVIRKIIKRAIQLKGTSISDYLLSDGRRGNYAKELKVYGRSGKLCLKCKKPLKTIQLAGRTTVFCPICQK
jgi:formamidopyrimidine-DNA glycosylase